MTRRRLEALFAGFAARADRRHRRARRGGGRRRAARGGRRMLIAGIDEAGRGPLAGPGRRGGGDPRRATADRRDCAIPSCSPPPRASGSPSRSARGAIAWCVACADVAEIDALNILQATLLAMRRAVEGLARRAGRGAGRRQPVPAARLPGARDREGRPRRRRDLGRVDPRQDRARRAAGRARRAASRLRLRAQQGLRHARASRRARPARPVPRSHRRSFAPVAQTAFDF